MTPSTILIAAILTVAMVPALAQTEPFSQVPTQEIPGRQIGWTVNRTLDAFTRAVDSGRALVMVFGDRTSDLTRSTGDLVVPCPQINQLAGAAVFAFGSPMVDEYARRMAVALKLTDYPTISVIAPRSDKLVELYRLEGFFDAATIAKDLEAALVRAKMWPQGRPRPGSLPTHYLAYPGKACTPQGAERLGFKIKTGQAPAPTTTPAPSPTRTRSTGTGFLVSTEGHMLTNHHVVKGCAAVTAVVPRYHQPMAPQMAREPMRVLRTDATNDLALLLFERVAAKPKRAIGVPGELGFLDNVHPLALACDPFLGFCPRPSRGQRVLTAGFPLQGTLSQINITDGIVSSFERIEGGGERIQITAPIQPGNSGGPLVNDRGDVVGVMVSTITWQLIAQRHGSMPQNINFAIPIGDALAMMKGLVAQQSLPTSGQRRLESTAAAGFLEMSTFLLECRS